MDIKSFVQWSTISCAVQNSGNNLRVGTYIFPISFITSNWICTGTHLSGSYGSVMSAYNINHGNPLLQIDFVLNSEKSGTATTENWSARCIHIGY